MKRMCTKCDAGPFKNPIEVNKHHREKHPKENLISSSKNGNITFLEQLLEKRRQLENDLRKMNEQVETKLKALGLGWDPDYKESKSEGIFTGSKEPF
jgi:hypothetical protein